MGAIVEKYIPRRLNTDDSPEGIFPNGDRMFLPGDLIDGENLSYYGFEEHGVLRSRAGNLLRSYTLPATGTTKCIGAGFYKTDGTIIYFLYNSTNLHRIVEYDPITQTFTTLLEASFLNLSLDNYLSGFGVIDNLIIWSMDGLPIRYMNIPKARTGFHQTNANAISLQLMSMPPVDVPTAVLGTQSSIGINLVSSVNLQFSYRFIYLDNQVSTFSKRSKLVQALPTSDITNTDNNVVDVTVKIPSEVLPWIKKVEVGYQVGNNGSIFIFNSFTPTLVSHTVRFTNTGTALAIAQQEQNTISHLIPPVSKTMEVIQSRVFSPLNSVGFDVEEDYTFETEVVTEEFDPDTTDPFVPHLSLYQKRFFKDGCTQGIGLLFEDEMGRTSFVRSSRSVSFPMQDSISEFIVVKGASRNRKRIDWTLSGTPPAGMKKCQIVLTKNNYVVHGQCLVNPLKYIRELTSGESDNVIDLHGGTGTDEITFNWRGKKFDYPKFLKSDGTVSQYNSMYLQIPTNFPFIVEPGFIVRVMNSSFTGDRNLVVKQVIGDFVDVGKIDMGSSDIPNFDTTIPWFIEIYKPKSVNDEIFYEIGEVIDIIGGAFSVTSGTIYGDTYLIELDSPKIADDRFYSYTPFLVDGAPTLPNTFLVDTYFKPINEAVQRVESPSNIFQSTLLNKASLATTTDFFGNAIATSVQYALVQGKSLNYNVIDADYGRAHTTNNNERESNFRNTFGYSLPYVQASQVNGLNDFLVENQYSIPIERSPVVRLIRATDVLLAIHERNTSSLYIGQGILKQGEDFLLARTDSVVGDNRQLKGEVGTFNQESVLEVDGDVYWWDGFRGRVIQYTLAGAFPISNYKREGFFLEKARQYAPYRSTVKIVSGFDYKNNEYLITFPTVMDGDDVVIQGETHAFNVKEKVWTTRWMFLPEIFANNTLQLFTFKDGALWEHEVNSIYNNFYGVQYSRKWTFAANPQLNKNKRYLNFHAEGDISADMTNEDIVVRITTKNGQETYIPAYEFEKDEGKWVASILKDINSPVAGGQLALRSGEDIVSRYITVEMICNRVDKAPVSEVNLVYKTEEFSV